MNHRCANCDKEWTNKDLKDPKDLFQRLAPGDMMPSGECPECGSFCFPSIYSEEKKPVTIEEHILFLCAHLSDIRIGLKEVAAELRKKNKGEEAKLRFNQKRQRLEALNFLKEGGLLELMPELKEKFQEAQKGKKQDGEEKDAATEAGGS